MTQRLKNTFLIHAIVSGVFGIVMTLFPGWFMDLVSWEPQDPVMTSIAGVAFIGLAVGSWYGYQAKSWAEVRIVVNLEIAFTVLGTIASLYYLLLADGPWFLWVAGAIWLLFAIAWIMNAREAD